MKITNLTLYKVPPRWLFLKIDTDEGISGWGEPVVEGRADTVRTAVEEFRLNLIGAGVGIGFTIFEEYLYGSSLASMIFRLFLIALHMLFGMIMAWYLGKARYQKLTGEGSPAVSRLLAFLIPIALHTLYDACTGTSAFLSAENEDLLMTGIIIGLAGTVVMFALQIFMLLRCKKKAEALSLMTF